MKDFFVEDILEKFEDYTQPVDQGPSFMNQEPRNMYNQGSSVDHAVRTIDPVQDSGNKIEEVLKAYGRYSGNRKGGRMSFSKFFELFSRENFVEGGRIGFDKGGVAKVKEYVQSLPENTVITRKLIQDFIGTNNIDVNFGNLFDKNRTSYVGNFVKNKSITVDPTYAASVGDTKKFQKSKDIINNPKLKKEFIKFGNQEGISIDDIRKKFNISGAEFYEGGLRDLFNKDFQTQAVRKIKTKTINNMLLLHNNKEASKYIKKGLIIPDEIITKLGLDSSEAATATVRLAQKYGGKDFGFKELGDIKKNVKSSDKLFTAMNKFAFGNPYRSKLYNTSLELIDEQLGNEKGTFASLKKKASYILKKNNIKGFDINEIAGVTGTARSGAGEFSQFIDVMDSNLNQKQMASFQSAFSQARQNIANNPNNFATESKKLNKLASRFEKEYGVDLPRIREVGDVEKYYSSNRLKQLSDQGLDIKKASKSVGYTIEMPKGATTINEFVNDSKKQIKVLKKMGFRCKKAGGGVEDVACYLDDVKKTKADARSSDVLKRAKALTKERKALQVAKTLPKVGNIIRKGVQLGAGAVSGALSAVGLGPVGFAIEAAVEGGFYDNARRNGYTHEQAYAETFLPKLITDAVGTTNTDTRLFEGAESLIEKEKLGKEDSLANQYNNALNIFKQETNSLDNMVGSYEQMVDGKQRDELLEKIYLQEAKVKNLMNTIKPGTPAYEAYQIAEETQTGRMENRKQDYLSMNRIPYIDAQGNIQEKTFPLSAAQIKQQEPSEFKIKQQDKRRDKEMAEYKTGYEGTLEPLFLQENEKANWSGAYGDGPNQQANKWKDIFEGAGAYDLTDKIAIAGGVSKMATGGLANLMKKYYD